MKAQWVPRHDAHAIEIAGLGISLKDPLSDVQLRKVLRVADNVTSRLGLTERLPVPEVQLQVNIEDGVPNTTERFNNNGMSFKKTALEENAVKETRAVAIEELVINRKTVIYRSRRYSRWTQFRQGMVDALTPVLASLLEATTVNNVRLEYRDRFTYSGDVAAAAPDELLQTGSPYIAPHVFDTAEPWHSYTGRFEEAPGARRRLIQIEINAVNSDRAGAQARSVAIMTAVQDDFEINEETEHVPGTVIDRLDGLHTRSMELMRALVNERTAQQIGLGQGD